MGTALATQNDNTSLDELKRTAQMLVASGYFDAKGAPEVQIAQIATKILAGRELGYGPFASVNGIHVIQGKPQISANLMASAVKSHPRYDYKVRKMEADAVTIEFFENGESLGNSTFTLADAKQAGTQNLTKFPRNMLFARALSNGVRWFCPDVFHGQAVYVEGEIEETEQPQPTYIVVEKSTGEVIEGETVTPVTPETVAPATNGHSNGTNGNGHKEMISQVQTAKLHAVGRDFYGDEWDAKRPALVGGVSKGKVTSSKELTAAQADALITALQKRLNERNEAQTQADEAAERDAAEAHESQMAGADIPF